MGVRGSGPTEEAAFEGAAMALTAVTADLQRVSPLVAVTVRCEAPDDELLLVDWLNTLVYEMATRRMLFSRFEVHLSNHRLEAIVWGEPVDPARHSPAVEVKGATYTSLAIIQDREGLWTAQCVVDV
jgi:tRNA nucleotidyltransferase (CCA-adding enzyme)